MEIATVYHHSCTCLWIKLIFHLAFQPCSCRSACASITTTKHQAACDYSKIIQMISFCGCPICHVSLTAQNTHRRALLFIDTRQFIQWMFTQTKLSSIYRHIPVVTYRALMKRLALPYNHEVKLKLAIISFFTVRSRSASGEILESVRQKEKNFEVPKRCKYIKLVYCCVMEKLLIFTKCET